MTQEQAKAVLELIKDEAPTLYDNLGYSDESIATDLLPFTTTDEFVNYLEENNMFDCNVIYYHNAMEYLAQNDASLTESVQLAVDMGYELKEINSELLATLHKTNAVREEYDNITAQTDNILNP